MVLWAPHHLGPDDLWYHPCQFSLYSICHSSLLVGPWMLQAHLTSGPLYLFFQYLGNFFHRYSHGLYPPFIQVSLSESPSLSILSKTVHAIYAYPFICFFLHNAWYYLKLYYVFNYLLMASPLECKPWVQGLCLVYSCIFSIQNSTWHVIDTRNLFVECMIKWMNEWVTFKKKLLTIDFVFTCVFVYSVLEENSVSLKMRHNSDF